MLKVQEFWCNDYPTDEEIKEAIVYANAHNCVCKIIFNYLSSFSQWKIAEYIYPADEFTKIKNRLIARCADPGLFCAPIKEEHPNA